MTQKSAWLLLHSGSHLRDALLGVHLHQDLVAYSEFCALSGNEAVDFSPSLGWAGARFVVTSQLGPGRQ